MRKIDVGYVKKNKKQDEKEKPGVQNHRHLNDEVRELAQNNCSFNARTEEASFAPMFFHIFFWIRLL